MSANTSSSDRFHARTDRILPSLRRRLLASVAVPTGGLVFILLYLAFLAARFTWYQSLAVVLSVIVLVPAILAAVWISFVFKVGGHWHDHEVDFD